MKNSLTKTFSHYALTNVARIAAIAAGCVTMSALTLAKPPIATPATQRNSVVAPIVATQLPPNFEPVLEINLNPELAHEQNEEPTQSNQSSLVSASCLGDLNYDGNIDSEDLGIILGAFGCSIGCESDLNADGNVNSADLGVLLIQFGVCPAPTVTAISPAYGSTSGGTTITLNGTNFFGASSVTVGGVAATSVNVVSASLLTAVTPAGSIGPAVSVSVTTPGGTGTLAGVFSYSSSAPPTVTAVSPASGLTSGGTSITVNGTNFSGSSSVTVGDVAATSVNVVSATVLTAVTPAGSIGPAVSVSVVTPGGIGTLASAFSYASSAPPTVTVVSPASGLTSGGTPITVIGTNFFGASSVTIGDVTATSVNVVSASLLTAVTPAGSIGPAVSVSVTTPGGTGTLASAFSYYEAGTPSWATVLEVLPDSAVVPDNIVRANIVASGLPWRVRDNSSGIEMLLIPGGTFTMGEEGYATPVHLTRAFYLGKTEVTQAQWQAKMGNNPSYFSGNANNPVEQVSWNDIAGFNTATGLSLPSEAEWEYACRGGTTTAFHSMPGYPNGTNDDSLLGNIAWYSGNNGAYGSSTYGTKPVAGKAANAFGMYDMSGNVFEWCNDWYGGYSVSNATDPAGPSTGSARVLRGGNWYGYSDYCRSPSRISVVPYYRNDYIGFRAARHP